MSRNVKKKGKFKPSVMTEVGNKTIHLFFWDNL